MSEPGNKPNNIVVIGGGITGLSACWYLQTRSEEPLDITLIESSQVLGGKMVTKKISKNGNNFIIDAGPESFVTRKPEAWELALELGLEDQIIDPGSETRNMYVLDGGVPKKIPLSPPAFITSDLLSFGGKLRMLLEPFIPARRDDEDESLADFVSRRLGEEALEKMIGPVLAGIYNTDPVTQSIMATSPVMREMEKEHGGLFKGAFARIRARKKQSSESPRRPQFMTFKDGAQVMVDALDEQLAIQLLRGTQAVGINNNGTGYTIEFENHDPLLADAVILATPGNVASKLLSQVDSEAASLIGEIEQKNIGTATLILPSDQIEMPFEINGLMIPRRENRRIDAITWTTNKPIPRGPEGYEMVRVFFGGDSSVVTLPEDEIIETILAELKDILGITATPMKTAVFCWPETFPQANVGHLNLVDEIEAQLPEGVYVAGNSYRGIGIPDCIRQGRDAAQKAIRFLNK
jgi:oxygen-dependent protoporphyrinogen oxidase